MRLYVTLVLRPPQQSEFVTEMMATIRADQPYVQPDNWSKKAKSMLFMPLVWLVWPISVGVGIIEIRKPTRTYPEPAPKERFRCQRGHLRMLTTPAEAQKLGVVIDPLGRAPALPFGHLNGAWMAFLDGQGADLSLWYFEVPLENTPDRHRLACRGFVWVKARKVQAEFVFEES